MALMFTIHQWIKPLPEILVVPLTLVGLYTTVSPLQGPPPGRRRRTTSVTHSNPAFPEVLFLHYRARSPSQQCLSTIKDS